MAGTNFNELKPNWYQRVAESFRSVCSIGTQEQYQELLISAEETARPDGMNYHTKKINKDEEKKN